MRKNLWIAISITVLCLAGRGGVGSIPGYASAVGINNGLVPRPLPNPKPLPPPPPEPQPPPLPDLSIGLRAYPTEAKRGDTVVFTIIVVNPEKRKAGGVDVLGLIPDGFDVLEISATHGRTGFNPSSHNLKTRIQSFGPETTATIMITTRVSALAQTGVTEYVAARLRYGEKPDTRQLFSNWVPVRIIGE